MENMNINEAVCVFAAYHTRMACQWCNVSNLATMKLNAQLFTKQLSLYFENAICNVGNAFHTQKQDKHVE